LHYTGTGPQAKGFVNLGKIIGSNYMTEQKMPRSHRFSLISAPNSLHFGRPKIEPTQTTDAYQRPNQSWLLGLLAVVVCTFGWPFVSAAQSGRPIVLTADTGVQFEGYRFSTKTYSVSNVSPGSILPSDFQVVDNGLRRVFLNPSHLIQDIGDSNQDKEISFDIYQRAPNWTEGGGTFVSVGPFDQYGHREFKIGITSGDGAAVQKTYVQGIIEITPRFCVLQNLAGNDTFKGGKQWEMRISTGTVPKEILRQILLARIKNPDKPDEYFDIALLFQQMGDFGLASEELRKIEADPRFPNLTERIRDARDQLGQLKARRILREIDLRKDSGQYDLAVQFAEVTNKNAWDRLAGDIKAELAAVQEEELETKKKTKATRDKILDLISRIENVNDDQALAIQRFKNELETELNRTTAPRLDAFLLVSDLDTTPDVRKLALAISGWMVGSNRARPELAVAQGMFAVRDLIREYLSRATTLERRITILKEIAGYEAGAPQYLDWMIQQMKPIESLPEYENHTGKTPIEFSIELPGTKADPAPRTYRCLAHLPPQYDPYRKYPLIVSLPGGPQTLEQNLQMWCGSYNDKLKIRQGNAMRNGYVVVTVDWRDPGQFGWQYTGREHRVVLDALWNAMRKFSIDSDRVLLSGHRDGGDGAYDVAVSHPEHWAGVLGFSGKFGMYIDKYWDNLHPQGAELAMYCVNGTKDYVGIRTMQDTINKWKSRKPYVNATVVNYRGRGNELFIEDLPEAFKWMRGQRRRWPDNSGFSFDCSSLRPWDSYFWFFEMHGTPENFVVRPELFEHTKKFNKLRIKGEISKPNEFRLEPQSMQIEADSTLWLSPQFVNLDETIVIRGRGLFKDSVRPSRQVILDDYLRRADREHIFYARIDCINGEWIANE
jgi:predicted esterase